MARLLGPLEAHPPGWPWLCRDVQQYAEHVGADLTALSQPSNQHNA